MVKGGEFCSKGCATSFRCAAHDPNIFQIQNKHILYYILGLIFTDGNVSKDNKKLTISLVDKDVIEKLAPYVIDTNKRKIYQTTPKLKNASTAYTLISTNVETIKQLKEFGVEANKTYTLEFPQIEDAYIYDFLRGVYDGDGCVYMSNKNYGGYYSISFTSGSQQFANGLHDKLVALGYSPRIVIDSRRKELEHKTYYVKLNKQDEVKDFLQNLYLNAQSIMIKNKYDKYYNKNMV